MGAADSSAKRAPLVFDVETIADLTAQDHDAVAALAKDRDLAPEHYGALCPPLARVVCIAWLDSAGSLGAFFDASLCSDAPQQSIVVEDGSSEKPRTVECTAQGCESEAEVLQQFGTLVERHFEHVNAQLVTYNGRGFDLPVLVHRAIKHGVTAGRELLTKAAWENRYRPLMHLDLMDVVTFGGAAPRWPMAAYAIGYGFKSPKTDMSGAQVGPAVRAGRLVDVVRYCAGDVLATAHVYQRLDPGSTQSAHPQRT